ncbi:1-propanol dehydrogenase PduQ [Atopobium fossor]|uniref:1-propanol dehydrogenase PduQ n=1 Tax=Atopobium fossor TaxID=39487 RepID=UPI000411FE13|nr:1-propanol dehydrogenase PduQ [Atopobium fossor]
MKEFKLKTELFFGTQAIHHLSTIDCSHVLVITDDFLAKSGMVAKMTQHLPQGVACHVYSNVKPDPSQELVDEGVEMICDVKPDLVISFGGGSCIDATKAILYFAHERGLKRPYFLAIPTTAGTGSEVTNFAIITRGPNKIALIDDFLAPDGALLEADFTRSVPPRITVDTGLDALSHALESYVSTEATPFSQALSVKVLRMIFEDLPVVYRDGMAMRNRARMMEAACAAGIAFTNAGLGINHSLAHALGGRFHVAHGRLIAILMPYVIAFHISDSTYAEPYNQLAHELGLQDAHALLEKIMLFLRELDVETSLSELSGIESAAFEKELVAMAEAAQHDRCTPTNVRYVSQQDLINIYRQAFHA